MSTNQLLCLIPLVFSTSLVPPSVSSGLTDYAIPAGKNPKVATPTFPLAYPYTIYRHKLSWDDAGKHCKSKHSRLAVFSKPEDAEKAIDRLHVISVPPGKDYVSGKRKAEFGGDRAYWIGLSNINAPANEWLWAGADEKLTYNVFWGPNFPSDFPDDEEPPKLCIALANPNFTANARHAFAERNCDERLYFICEDLVAVTKKPSHHSGARGRMARSQHGLHHKRSLLRLRSRKRYRKVKKPEPESSSEETTTISVKTKEEDYENPFESEEAKTTTTTKKPRPVMMMRMHTARKHPGYHKLFKPTESEEKHLEKLKHKRRRNQQKLQEQQETTAGPPDDFNTATTATAGANLAGNSSTDATTEPPTATTSTPTSTAPEDTAERPRKKGSGYMGGRRVYGVGPRPESSGSKAFGVETDNGPQAGSDAELAKNLTEVSVTSNTEPCPSGTTEQSDSDIDSDTTTLETVNRRIPKKPSPMMRGRSVFGLHPRPISRPVATTMSPDASDMPTPEPEVADIGTSTKTTQIEHPSAVSGSRRNNRNEAPSEQHEETPELRPEVTTKPPAEDGDITGSLLNVSTVKKGRKDPLLTIIKLAARLARIPVVRQQIELSDSGEHDLAIVEKYLNSVYGAEAHSRKGRRRHHSSSSTRGRGTKPSLVAPNRKHGVKHRGKSKTPTGTYKRKLKPTKEGSYTVEIMLEAPNQEPNGTSLGSDSATMDVDDQVYKGLKSEGVIQLDDAVVQISMAQRDTNGGAGAIHVVAEAEEPPLPSGAATKEAKVGGEINADMKSTSLTETETIEVPDAVVKLSMGPTDGKESNVHVRAAVIEPNHPPFWDTDVSRLTAGGTTEGVPVTTTAGIPALKPQEHKVVSSVNRVDVGMSNVHARSAFHQHTHKHRLHHLATPAQTLHHPQNIRKRKTSRDGPSVSHLDTVRHESAAAIENLRATIAALDEPSPQVSKQHGQLIPRTVEGSDIMRKYTKMLEDPVLAIVRLALKIARNSKILELIDETESGELDLEAIDSYIQLLHQRRKGSGVMTHAEGILKDSGSEGNQLPSEPLTQLHQSSSIPTKPFAPNTFVPPKEPLHFSDSSYLSNNATAPVANLLKMPALPPVVGLVNAENLTRKAIDAASKSEQQLSVPAEVNNYTTQVTARVGNYSVGSEDKEKHTREVVAIVPEEPLSADFMDEIRDKVDAKRDLSEAQDEEAFQHVLTVIRDVLESSSDSPAENEVR